ncbi:MAG: FIST N-terminal domain-containing protein [Rhizobacter sp.]
MKLFLHAHATHPDWRMALSLATAQLEGQRAMPDHIDTPTLGWLYLTDHYAPAAEHLLDALRAQWPGVAWVGSVGIGVAANGVEYFDEPALSLMLGDIAPEHFRVFSGVRPLSGQSGFSAAAAQVHADPSGHETAELIAELADQTSSGYLFGGLSSGRGRTAHIADGVFVGGLSGVAFDAQVPLISRVTQGCQPIGAVRRISEGERNLVVTLDNEPALAVLLRDLNVDAKDPREALPRLRGTLVGLSDSGRTPAHGRSFGVETRVRHLVGIDPGRHAVAIGDVVEPGMQLAFCQRNTEAARRDLVRICAEIREELEPDDLPLETALALNGGALVSAPHPARQIAGAVYVSCSGRGGPHFGAPSAELAIVRHALGDVPLVGFFANGEIAHRHLYGYTGVLTVFTAGPRTHVPTE